MPIENQANWVPTTCARITTKIRVSNCQTNFSWSGL